MKYVAIFGTFPAWPAAAKQTYINLYGKKAYNTLEHDESALWLGSWLVEHQNEFIVRSKIDYNNGIPNFNLTRKKSPASTGGGTFTNNDDMNEKDIYALFNTKKYNATANVFYWLSEDKEVCNAYVKIVPNNTIWTIEYKDFCTKEKLILYKQPNKNGYLKKMII